MSTQAKPSPVSHPFWTPGVLFLLAIMLNALVFVVFRFTGGLAAVTNLSQSNPWGLWIGVDVATGVALAAGGFTTAAQAHIFGRHSYEPVTRPALLTAMLGYTFVAIGLFIDIGRSWAIWKPIVYWQPNSVLFEVAMCVVVYLHVLYIEFIPVIVDQYKDRVALPGPLRVLNGALNALLAFADRALNKVMWIFIIAGVVLSCMHQSGLGSLLLIAPTKVHPLWYTPILPLLFLTSAIAVGYPMVVFETTLATSALKLEDEMGLLTPLTRITIILLGIYIGLKVGDMIVRGTYAYLFDGSVQSRSFIVEMLPGSVIPWVMLLTPAVRNSRRWLFTACALIVGGVALNRINVFLVAFQPPPFVEHSYFPAIGEMAITAGLIATIVFLYRFLVKTLPILSGRSEEVIR
jgi:Ni/Fe-hydrogenase subunit HybB-like protein